MNLRLRLAQAIDWPVLEERFGAVHSDGPGMPPLPTRLMAGLAILKHTFNLSDEVLRKRDLRSIGGTYAGVPLSQVRHGMEVQWDDQ
ncbi:hypothetical protein CIT26_05615 [Mesorhizobium temperatum]|uniref:Transposase InsH N-terminal domain-containing protein n=1 Tax=Mesorhizobium temperatum TaxID=241416 RepID=A0A271LVD5_9HYPH|nr:hypothetical protein CIT26_05615 [Mesorhizobium temperatum]